MIYQNRDDYLFVKITNDNNYQAHMHRQVEIFYVLDGAIEMTISGQKKLLEKGMVSIAFPNVVHETCTPGHSSAVMIIFNHIFLPDFSAEFSTRHPQEPFVAGLPDAGAFASLVEGLLDNAQKNTDIRISKGYLYAITSMILSHITLLKQDRLYDAVGPCQEISNYLNQHFSEEISLSQLAGALGYSKYHISHIFKDKFGCSYSDYLRRLRAEYAMGLLTHSELSVTEICFASGFSSLRSFYRAFHEIYGASPGSMAR